MARYYFVLLSFIFLGCEKPEDKVVGMWEYEKFSVDESGIGSLLKYLPENWLLSAEEWLSSTKGITNSRLEFYPDGTYRELFTGAAEKFSDISGNYTVSSELDEIHLLINDKEQIMRIENLTDTSFIYLKEFDKYETPLTLRVMYVKTSNL